MFLHSFVFTTFIFGIGALRITAPGSGATLDPLQPITVSWESTSADPSTFDLVIDQQGGLTSNFPIANGVSTSTGTIYIPAGSVASYGTGFVIKAESSGTTIAQSSPFDLAVGISTSINGQLSFISSATFTGTISDATGLVQTPRIATTTSSDSSSPLNQGPAISTSTESNTISTGSRTGFSTSTTSATGTTARSSTANTSSTSSASATTSANAQPRLASGSQIAFSVAGILAGVVALLA